MAVATAGWEERTVEAIVPGAIFIHIPQTVLVPTDCETTATARHEAKWHNTRFVPITAGDRQCAFYRINFVLPPKPKEMNVLNNSWCVSLAFISRSCSALFNTFLWKGLKSDSGLSNLSYLECSKWNCLKIIQSIEICPFQIVLP